MADIFINLLIDGSGTAQKCIQNASNLQMTEEILFVICFTFFFGFLTAYAINCFIFFRHYIFQDGKKIGDLNLATVLIQ